MNVALIGCSKTKKKGTEGERVPARQLYTSPLFRKSLSLAEATSDVVYIVSASHHLLAPDDLIGWYDDTLSSHGKRDRRNWAGRVAGILVGRHRQLRDAGSMVTIYAGQIYTDVLYAALHWEKVKCSLPLKRLQVGQRLAKLNELLAEVKKP